MNAETRLTAMLFVNKLNAESFDRVEFIVFFDVGYFDPVTYKILTFSLYGA